MGVYSDSRLKVFSGRSHPGLAEEICQQIGVPLGDALVSPFSDGEIRVVINENVRGSDVFVVQPTIRPNESIMELCIMIDALRRASATRITAVVPYYGYARQDRKTRGREPITAKLVANLITTAGANRVICVDLHAGQIQGFFDLPVDHLSGIPLLAKYYREKDLRDVVIVSPDAGGGGIPRAREMADRLGVPLAIVDKRRPEPNVSEVMNVIGPVRDRTAILVDDIIDTAGTICHAAKALMEHGALEVLAAGMHPLLTDPAVLRLQEAPLSELVVLNTIPLRPEAQALAGKLHVLSIAPLLGEAIVRVHEDLSVSKLFV